MLEKAIAQQVARSLAIEELEAAAQFRHIAVKDDLAYAICPRKRQRVAEEIDDSEPYWLMDNGGGGIASVVEARRVVRNNLFQLPSGPSVPQQRRQYHADMQKYGEVIPPTSGKRNYDGAPKRAYNNDLLTHTIMKPLLAFPMLDLSFEFVLESAIRDANKAHGREQARTRNVRQPIAIYGESDFSIIEEEEEPQSPTAKLPHFPSTATHQSNASRKNRLDQGAVNLQSKIIALTSQLPTQEPASPSPLSSPIGPGFTFEVPSFISSPIVTRASDADEAEEAEKASEETASPMVVFKDRSQAADSAFKKRRSLPATRRLSFSTPLRRASLPAAGAGQLPVVQDLQDPASGSLAVAPDSSVELPAVHNPLEVDLASAAAAQASPSPAGGAASASPLPVGSSSPVVVDVRENPDIFGSFQDRPGSPVQALASLTRVFEEAKEKSDPKVIVTKEDGRLIVRFKVSDEYASFFADEEPAMPTSPMNQLAELPVALADQQEEEEEEKEEEKEEEEKEEEEKKEEKEEEKEVVVEAVDEVMQVPAKILDDEADMAMLREFMSRHAARKAAKAAEAAEPVALDPAPVTVLSPVHMLSVPILPDATATPERTQSVWADTPVFSITSSAERPQRSPRKASPAATSTTRRPLGALDVNSPSPKKVKRKADDVDEREVSPEKQPPKRQRKTRADKDENEKPKETGEAPPPGVRTRAQRAAERGDAPPVTKIPMRHQGYAKMRNGEKDLAAMTRQNTRANKGDAISAEEVLEAMKNAPPIVEMSPVAAAKKDGKAVQWAEQLTTTRSMEPYPVECPLSPVEEKQVGKATRGRPKGSAAKPTKIGKPAVSAPKTEGAKVTKPKKVTAAAKKELGLSANGTPAKRSRRIAEKK